MTFASDIEWFTDVEGITETRSSRRLRIIQNTISSGRDGEMTLDDFRSPCRGTFVV